MAPDLHQPGNRVRAWIGGTADDGAPLPRSVASLPALDWSWGERLLRLAMLEGPVVDYHPSVEWKVRQQEG